MTKGAKLSILLISLTILFAFILGKRLSRPIDELVVASKAISDGNYKIRFDDFVASNTAGIPSPHKNNALADHHTIRTYPSQGQSAIQLNTNIRPN